MVAASVVPLAGILAYSIYANAARAVAEAESAARTLAAATAFDTAHTLKANLEALRALAERPLVRAVDRTKCDPVLRQLRPLFPATIDIAVFNLRGEMVCSAVRPPGATFSVANSHWFKQQSTPGEVIIGAPTWGVNSGRWLSVLGQPIRNRNKQAIGLIVMPLDLAIYVPTISAAPLPPGTEAGIVTSNGAFVWRNQPPAKWMGQSVDAQSPLRSLLDAKQGTMEGKGPDTESLLYAITPVPGANWYAFVGIPTRVVYAEVRAGAMRNSLLGLSTLLAIVAIALFLSRRIQKPVQSLAATIHAVREGEQHVRASAGGVREIAELADDFNLMLDHLRESERRLRDVFESVSLLAVMLDVHGDVTFCNQKVLDLTGWTRDEAIGKNWFRTFRPPEKSEAHLASFLRNIAGGSIPLHYEGDVIARNGDRFVIYWSHTLMRDSEGRVIGVASLGQDITHRKQADAEIERLNRTLEQRVAERTAELDRANKELESFAYSVSHDLRGPARAMIGFSSIVLEKSKDRLDRESIEHLMRIDAGARRMGRLIDDLLRLSRISRMEMRRRDINLSQLAQDVAESLIEAYPDRKIRISIESRMRVNGDPGLIRILLENVLGNACKFTARKEESRVEVGCEPREDSSVYFVRDNGAGFDMQFADKLFAPFQRLHRQDEFEGTGIGLSIVSRIVAMHSGSVWAQAQVDQGATVYFTLAPANHAAESGRISRFRDTRSANG